MKKLNKKNRQSVTLLLSFLLCKFSSKSFIKTGKQIG